MRFARKRGHPKKILYCAHGALLVSAYVVRTCFARPYCARHRVVRNSGIQRKMFGNIIPYAKYAIQKKMKCLKIDYLQIFIFFFIWSAHPIFADAQISSWNLFKFGKSKLAKPEAMEYIAQTLRDADIAALQEVSTGIYGARAVSTLADLLNRKGSKWDYSVSDPTTGNGSERYAFVFRTARVRLIGRPWLEASLAEPLDREPYMARFRISELDKADCLDRRCILLVTFHAVPTAKNPAAEIELLSDLRKVYPDDNLILTGDFNLSESASAFDGIKELGLVPCLKNQKTSLKVREKDGEHLANEYDNIFFSTTVFSYKTCKVVDFTVDFENLPEAHRISDHLPVFVNIDWQEVTKQNLEKINE